MFSRRPKLPIAKERKKSSLADTMRLKIERPVKLYKQPRSTISALQQAPENTPDHTIAVAQHPLTFDLQKCALEESQTQSTHHQTIVLRKSFTLPSLHGLHGLHSHHSLHGLQRGRTKSSQEDTPARATFLCNEPHTSRLDP